MSYMCENHRQNVSTLDFVYMMRDMLGIENHLDIPYKIIATDINTDNKLTVLDLVQIRKLILGILGELPQNESMRFVNADYDFPDPKNP